jgi:hypothetical protein
MSYGVPSPYQQSIKPVSRALNKNQYDAFYFTDFHNQALVTFVEGGVFNTVTSTGTVTYNPTDGITGFGQTACSGTVRLSTTATSSSTAYAGIQYGSSTVGFMPLQIPASTSVISKYEFETLIRTGSVIFLSSATNGGQYRMGLGNNVTTAPTDGVWIEYLQDGTTNDTTFWIAWASAGNSKQRVDTGVTVSTNTIYRIYLSIEINTAGTFTTTYKIKNITTGVSTEGTANPANTTGATSRYWTQTSIGTAATVFMGRQTNTSTTQVDLLVDYIGVRIRKPIAREILLGTL